jgi:hypothetical protein
MMAMNHAAIALARWGRPMAAGYAPPQSLSKGAKKEMAPTSDCGRGHTLIDALRPLSPGWFRLRVMGRSVRRAASFDPMHLFC